MNGYNLELLELKGGILCEKQESVRAYTLLKNRIVLKKVVYQADLLKIST